MTFRDRLKEDEKTIFDIVGEERYIEIQKAIGGFSVYISKPYSKEAILSELKKGKTKREICVLLRMSDSQYYNVLNERSED